MPEHQQRPVLSVVRSAADRDPCALVPGLAGLSVLIGRLGPLLEQVTRYLADRPTVTAHLQQARTGLEDAKRSVDHAIGTLDFNAGCARHSGAPPWTEVS